jgi:acetylornithine deacetylase/succinyl-diaminopimelate desuccinylase-like protein
MTAAMHSAYGSPVVELGQGGSIPLCGVFATTYPEAEIILIGVEEPQSLIHAPNESVHPEEIADMALTEALFLQNYATARITAAPPRAPSPAHPSRMRRW